MLVNCKKEDILFFDKRYIDSIYLSDIRKYPLLTYEEERKLLKDAKQDVDKIKKKKAYDKLVCCNQKFIYSVAKKLSIGDDLMDIVNQANIGLIKAIDYFDLNRDTKFITYAVFWIKQEINLYKYNKDMVKPVNQCKIFTYVNKIKRDFLQKNERYPMLSEIQENLNSKYGLNICLSDLEGFSKVSLTIDNDNDEYSTNPDSIMYNYGYYNNNIYSDINNEYIKYKIKCLLSYLTDREKVIIKKFYGIECESETMESIAKYLGLNKERIRQIINEIITKLKKLNISYED